MKLRVQFMLLLRVYNRGFVLLLLLSSNQNDLVFEYLSHFNELGVKDSWFHDCRPHLLSFNGNHCETRKHVAKSIGGIFLNGDEKTYIFLVEASALCPIQNPKSLPKVHG